MRSSAELSSEAASAGTPLDLKRILMAALSRTGFDAFQLLRFKSGTFVDQPWCEPPDLAAAWHPTANGDPYARHALERDGPLLWHEADLSSGTGPEVGRFLEMTQAAGVVSAATIPLHRARHACDVLHVFAISSALRAVSRDEIWRLAAIAFAVTCRLHELEPVPLRTSSVSLTERELDVLGWSKEGKSYSEIGIIMRISSKTVEFHMSNIMRKLGVNQKIAAIMAALKLGLLKL